MSDESTTAADVAQPQHELASSTPTAREASRMALFGVVLVIIVLVVAGGVWWYAGSSGAAAQLAAGEKINKELGGFAHPLREGTPVNTVNVSAPAAQANLDAIVALLPTFSELGTLSADGAELTDEHLQTIGELDSLIALVLTNNKNITDEGVRHLTGLHQLSTFELYGTQVTEKGLESVAELRSLKTLNIGNSKVKGDLSELLPLVNLEWLVAGDMELSDDVVDTLAKLPKLAHLQIPGARISNEALAEIREKKPGIKISGSPARGE